MRRSFEGVARLALPGDRAECVRMRTALWPDSTPDEVDASLSWSPELGAVIVAEQPDTGLWGFAEVETRNW